MICLFFFSWYNDSKFLKAIQQASSRKCKVGLLTSQFRFRPAESESMRPSAAFPAGQAMQAH